MQLRIDVIDLIDRYLDKQVSTSGTPAPSRGSAEWRTKGTTWDYESSRSPVPEDAEVLTTPRGVKWWRRSGQKVQVGISPATVSGQRVTEHFTEKDRDAATAAREVLESDTASDKEREKAQQDFKRLSEKGRSYLNSELQKNGFTGVQVRRNFGMFMNEFEPSLYVLGVVEPERFDEFTDLMVDIAGDDFDQKQLIVHTPVQGDAWHRINDDNTVEFDKDATAYPAFGVIDREKGESIEPSMSLFFEEPLTAKQFKELGERIDKISGSSMAFAAHPNGKGIDILNLTVYQDDHDQFVDYLKEILEDDDVARLTGQVQHYDIGTNRVRTLGKEKGSDGRFGSNYASDGPEYDGVQSYRGWKGRGGNDSSGSKEPIPAFPLSDILQKNPQRKRLVERGFYKKQPNGLVNWPPVRQGVGRLVDGERTTDRIKGDLTLEQAAEYALKVLKNKETVTITGRDEHGLPAVRQGKTSDHLIYHADDDQRIIFALDENGDGLEVRRLTHGERANKWASPNNPKVKAEMDRAGGVLAWADTEQGKKAMRLRDRTSESFLNALSEFSAVTARWDRKQRKAIDVSFNLPPVFKDFMDVGLKEPDSELTDAVNGAIEVSRKKDMDEDVRDVGVTDFNINMYGAWTNGDFAYISGFRAVLAAMRGEEVDKDRIKKVLMATQQHRDEEERIADVDLDRGVDFAIKMGLDYFKDIKKTVKAMRAEQVYTEKRTRELFGDSVTVYRAVYGDPANHLRKGLEEDGEVELDNIPGSSFSTSADAAMIFALVQHGIPNQNYDFVIMKHELKADEILSAWYSNTGFNVSQPYQQEVLANPKDKSITISKDSFVKRETWVPRAMEYLKQMDEEDEDED